MLNKKQELFCAEYAISFNASQSAINAGYSKKTAFIYGYKLLKNPEIQQRIEEIRKEIGTDIDSKIADAKDVMRYLTSVLRGEDEDNTVVVVNIGNSKSEARIIKKPVGTKEKLKASEILTKVLGMNGTDTNINITPVIISGEDELLE